MLCLMMLNQIKKKFNLFSYHDTAYIIFVEQYYTADLYSILNEDKNKQYNIVEGWQKNEILKEK